MTDTNDQPQLFETSPILEWLPDESLFSLVSRIHFLSGRQLAGLTSCYLFKGQQSGTHHDLPNCLSEFEHVTQGHLGTAQETAFNRTLLKYYRSFIPASQSESIAESMQGSSVAHLKFQLGLITSRFRANHPLKVCPSCMVDDHLQLGWAYWHLEHQYPGVWWCDTHHQILRESLIKSTGVGRFLWHLPSHKSLRDSPNIEFSKETINSIRSLSQTAKSLVKIGNKTPWDPKSFWLIYRKELANRGWLAGQRLRYPEMTSDFLIYSSRLRLLPELRALPTTIDEAKSQLGRLLRRPRTGTHPLRHIILIDWLFDGVDCFLNIQNKTYTHDEEKISQHSDTQNSRDTHKFQEKAEAIKLLQNQNMSMRSIAKKTGIDINTIMSWAIDAGRSINRRPKILKENKRKTLIKKLRQGMDKTTLTSQMGISIVTINRLLRTEPELHSQWKLAHFNKTLNNARNTWKSLIDKYSQIGTKLLRNMEPAVYAWLYRNDRDWLRKHSPHTNKTRETTENKTLWDKRDLTISTEVKRAALHLTQTNSHTKIRLWQLYQQVPELKAKLEVLHRLPLTKRAIEEILSYPTPDLTRRLF